MYTINQKIYDGFPLSEKALPDYYIEEFSIMSDSRIVLYTIYDKDITINRISGSLYATAKLDSDNVGEFFDTNGDYVGYIKTNGKRLWQIINKEIIHGVTMYQNKPITGTANFISTQYYIPVLNDNVLTFEPNKYCGPSKPLDAIYRINGLQTDWNYSGYITITTSDNIVMFSSKLPDELCERDAEKGPQGPKGPKGPSGDAGKDAVEVIINFDRACQNVQP